MNRLEEIQEIIKNFIYEKQQMKQQITEIENERNKLAQDRNKRKLVNLNIKIRKVLECILYLEKK